MGNQRTLTAIIGGSGLDELDFMAGEQREISDTPYGAPSAPFSVGTYNGQPLVFMQRHGAGHHLAPHEINYRANLWALQSMGVTEVFAVAATGGIPQELGPKTLVIPHQIVDYTYGRKHTYFDDPKLPVQHIDFTYPYTEALRQRLLDSARHCGIAVVEGGVYAATQGPRLETAAEIDRLERDGATLVGMTGMPEAALARELELDYACLSLVVNLAAGRADGVISHEQIYAAMREGIGDVNRILEQLFL